MEEELVIYTDGHGVKITPFQFIIGKTSYLMNGITSVRLLTIRANRDGGFILIIMGLGGIALGLLGIISPQTMLKVNGASLSPNDIAWIAGLILLIIGILWSFVVRDKFAVRITTAEGIKDPI